MQQTPQSYDTSGLSIETLLKVGSKMKSAEGGYKPNPGPDGANLFIYHLPQVGQKSSRDPQLTISPNRSSQTPTSAKHSNLSAPSSQPRSSSTSRQTSPSALVSHHKYSPESNFRSNRICLVHHQRGSPRRHPGHERLPGRHQEAQGPAEEAQGRKQTLLNKKIKVLCLFMEWHER